jgi:uncharacterized protein (DUF1810 family)
MTDPFELQRFVDAQAPLRAQVERELAAGRKTTHWMWFVFPQLRGLGRSATAQHFGLGSLAEAVAYWQHPVLGPRLLADTQRVLAVPQRRADAIFGTPDDLKFHSSMSLFARAAPTEAAFSQALERFFAGRADTATLALLGD